MGAEVSPALKEIANRIKKLSYRDMVTLSDLVHNRTFQGGMPVQDALLSVADDLEGVK